MDHYLLTLIYGGGPLCTIPRLKATCDEALRNFAFQIQLAPLHHGAGAGGVARPGGVRHGGVGQ